MTIAELAASAEIRAHAEAGRITLSHPARQRGTMRGARFADIRHALTTALSGEAQSNGCWRIDSADTDGDELTVIVAIWHDVLVITVFQEIEPMKCPLCNKGAVKAADVEISERVAGHTFTATIHGEQCDACNEVFYPGPAVEAFEIAVARALTSTDEAGGETFKYARKAVGLRAEDLASLLGVARETISRWETGKHPIDSAALAVLALIVKDAAQGSTSTLEVLRARREAKPLSKRVALKLAS